MKRLGRNEARTLEILTEGHGDRRLWSARMVATRDQDAGGILNTFAAERALERIVDRGLAERVQHGYGSGPRAYAITSDGENAAARLRG